MKISVIITLYNKAPYILRCINSVNNQTYDDIEGLIIDDCSTDDSLRISVDAINQYKGNVRWRIIHMDTNVGVSSIRNKGIAEAAGDYIYYIDADDEIVPNCLENFVSVLEKHPNVEVIVGKIVSVPYNNYYNTDYFDNIDYIDSNLWVRKQFYGDGERIPVNPVNKLVKKDFLVTNKLFYKPNIYHEDELWMFFVVKKLKEIAFVHKDTYLRYYVANSIMTSNPNKGNMLSWSIVLNTICQNFDSPLRRNQVRKYLFEYLYRYNELDEISSTRTLNRKFSKQLLRVCMFNYSFALYRLNSTNADVVAIYKEKLFQSMRNNQKLLFIDVLKNEIAALRIKLSLGKYLH